ncbi:MAG: dethiobiotin synthase [Legionellaceae bacterium]|nr:dethiobiotin synthase [Legionellaceae bacterium]HAF88065.1 dethiobiotin synthase [Legionellales bacterium]|tara:strand:- start:1953 stop:2591 length:639 start_codon:yes stop_codon:yes gene_type:complete
MKSFFITGTDTDCGKTYVTCALLNWLKTQHYQARALKPVATGTKFVKGRRTNDDIEQLMQANHDTTEIIHQSLFDEPVSPHLAAKLAGRMICMDEIIRFCQSFTPVDYQFIEGAGGMLVPLNEQETWLDFVQKMQIPIILVVGIRLGCINHALLTDSLFKQYKLNCRGWIANCIDKQTLYQHDIINTLKNKMNSAFLTKIEYYGMIEHFNLP